jgi:type VI secretion system protein ImpH
MAPQKWQKIPVIEKLYQSPTQFNFFQAVRLFELEQFLKQGGKRGKLGSYFPIQEESVFLKGKTSLEFSITGIESVKKTAEDELPQLFVNFLGLNGPNGSLPFQDTFLILRRVRDGDQVLKDYLDSFNHRLLSFFYRAWAKNRFYIGFENKDSSLDTGARIFKSLHGETIFSSQNILPKHFGIFFSGILLQKPSSFEGLKCLLEGLLLFPVTIKNNLEKWILIPPEEQTTFRSKNNAGYNDLGVNAVLGKKFCSCDTYFQVSIGPLDWDQFEKLLPESNLLQKTLKVIRYYTPQQLKYELQLVLKADQVPKCQLKRKESFRLGLNTWLLQKVCDRDKGDTVLRNFKHEDFVHEGSL